MLLLILVAAQCPAAAAATCPRLRVSDNKRFLVTEKGEPFFWLGDTAWEIFHRLNREEADRYLQNRAAKKFNVVQAVVLAELDGLNTPNAFGHRPLHENDPSRPNEAYFQHVDYVLRKADSLGIYIALLPTWASYVNDAGARIFTAHNAAAYGRWLGRRYREQTNLVWVLGGDRLVDGAEAVWRAMADGIAAGAAGGDHGKVLMTFHPRGGGHSSSTWFHKDDWLDFNMMQTGPGRRNFPNYQTISADYHRLPIKPTIDAEPGYERASPKIGRLNEHDVRKWAYWAVFAGAFGHTYGALEVWQMYHPGSKAKPVNGAELPWPEALELPAAGQMRHLRTLMESRPMLTRIPDQSLIAGDKGQGADHVRATRASDGGYAFVYIPTGKPIYLDLNSLSGGKFVAHWFNPRTGERQAIGGFSRDQQPREFRPPMEGLDWVLVVDDESRGYVR